MNTAALVAGTGGVLLTAAGALGQSGGAPAAGLTLDVSGTLLSAIQTAGQEAGGQAEAGKPEFGYLFKKGEQERAWFLTVGAGVARDSDPGTHADVFVAWSTFLGRGLEIQIEASGWYFDQARGDTGGAGLAFNLRWHGLHGSYGQAASDGYDWTLYADLGIGVIASGDDVPPEGSSFNLAPRVGVGFTARLGESDRRLVAGVRWHHMSNARVNGDSNNPDFNAPMFYVGLEWPL